jgi:hypothetical protein
MNTQGVDSFFVAQDDAGFAGDFANAFQGQVRKLILPGIMQFHGILGRQGK